MSNERASYRQIVKATSIFGGVQAYNIALALVRNKLLAVVLGPAGMGLSGLLTSTTAMIASLTDLGLGTSAVRDIAAAHASGSTEQLSEVTTVFRRLVWFSGLLGAAVTVALAPWLSSFAFGDRGQTMSFVAIAITLLFGQLSAARSALLQGTRRLANLAKLNMIGGTLSLAVSLPLYFWMGQAGVVPAIVASGLVSLGVAAWFGRRVSVPSASVSLRATWRIGRTMAALGLAVSLNGVLLTGSAYVTRAYLSSHGSLADVGLYSAGLGMLNMCVGMVFNAMLADYFPRLSAVIHEDDAWRKLVNQQASFSLLILAPLLATFIVFVRPAVMVLYSDRFLAVNSMMRWAAVGILFKVVAWPVGFIFVPKGHARLFLAGEVAGTASMLGFSLLGFSLDGLTGIGVGFAAGYGLYTLQSLAVVRWVYQFRYESDVLKLVLTQSLLVGACLTAVLLIRGWPGYVVGALAVGVSASFSIVELDKRLGLKQTLVSLDERFRRR